jgi:cytochrome c-type biogenesis protein CcmH/NrfF
MYSWPDRQKQGGIEMGRFFEGPWALWTLFPILIVVIALAVVLVVRSGNKSKRAATPSQMPNDSQPPHDD